MTALRIEQEIGQSPANNVVVRHLKGQPCVSDLRTQMESVSAVIIRYLAPDGIIAFQGNSNRFNLDIIDAFTGIPRQVATDQYGKINAEFSAYSHQDRKAISA